MINQQLRLYFLSIVISNSMINAGKITKNSGVYFWIYEILYNFNVTSIAIFDVTTVIETDFNRNSIWNYAVCLKVIRL